MKCNNCEKLSKLVAALEELLEYWETEHDRCEYDPVPEELAELEDKVERVREGIEK